MRRVLATLVIAASSAAGCGARSDPSDPRAADDSGGNQTPGLGIPCSEVDPRGNVRWVQIVTTASDSHIHADPPWAYALFVDEQSNVSIVWRSEADAMFAGSKVEPGAHIARLGADGCLQSPTGTVPLDGPSRSRVALLGADAFVLYPVDGRIVAWSNGNPRWESEELYGFSAEGELGLLSPEHLALVAGCSFQHGCGTSNAEALLMVGSLRTTDGTVAWTRTFSATGESHSGANAYPTAIAGDGAGKTTIAGRYHGTLRLDDLTFQSEQEKSRFIAQLDGQGELLWAQDIETDGELAADAAGNIYQLARPCTAGTGDFGLVKRSGDSGEVDWASCSGLPLSHVSRHIDSTALAVFPDGFSIMVAGIKDDSGFLPEGLVPPERPEEGLLLVAHDALGNHVGSKLLGVATLHNAHPGYFEDVDGDIRNLIAKPAPDGDLVLVGGLNGGLHEGDVEVSETFALFVMKVSRDGWAPQN